MKFLREEKIFFGEIFLNLIYKWSTFQRTQARLQGVKPARVASKTLSDILKSANACGFYKTVFVI